MHGSTAATRRAPRTHQLWVRTGDNVTLSVRCVAAEGPTRGAIVMCHGLASTGEAFDVPGRSLARHFAEAGYSCFVPSLRGAGRSARPSSGVWGLDDYVEQDLPAILSLVSEYAHSDRITWLGHSMGGILFWLYAIDNGEVPVQRAIMLASALDYRPGFSVYQPLNYLRPLFPERFVMPVELSFRVAGALARFDALRAVPLPPDVMNFNRDNVEPDIRAHILADGFGDIPVRLLKDLSTGLEPGGLARRAGTHAYLPRLSRYRTRTLLAAGAGDLQCGVEAVDQTARLLRHLPDLRVLPFGVRYGHAADYGHFDLIVGRKAPVEVWPHLMRFVEEPA